ncbi:MAG TPA: ABC-F family ATP-binding cassette domain-containing protein [Myxococcota bacterium]|nr:ABC-F family ATP-binding cassette domain-containing protein [Myxococcota bacterium]HRY93729.1 ABC-F family ATP-binding cassette domain-containing protein [Myxococcota bacterium]
MLSVQNLSKSFGGQKIFEDVSFLLSPGERLGLVGRNGHGKTTLFRLIVGEEHPDAGEISLSRGYRLGYLTQELAFQGPTLLDEACRGLQPEKADERWRVEKVLAGLGFSRDDLARHPAVFSGGYQVRLNLAKVLVGEPDLLLLDEPTNYLDVVSIRWLSEYLRAWRGEVFLITHDRKFMDDVATHILGIHRCKLRKVRGTTEKLYEQLAREEEVHEKTRLNDERKRREVELFIERFRAKATLASRVQSRVKSLAKMERREKLETIKDLEFTFRHEPTPAKTLLTAAALTFGYDPEAPPLIRDFSLAVGPTDRVCVIGQNGKGKTTLLRLLVGDLSPARGELHWHPRTRVAYYAQTNVKRLDEGRTVEEELMSSGCERQRARDLCGLMMFEGDDALKRVGVLSGGERSRVLLAKLLLTPANLLVLDEPTNHLDMQSADAMLTALDEYPGAVVMVTHNEMFLHALANRFVVFQGGEVSVFEGSYQDFLEKVGWAGEERPVARAPEEDEAAGGRGPNRRELRRLRAEVITRQGRALGPLAQRIQAIEARIEELEEAGRAAEAELVAQATSGDGKRLGDLARAVREGKVEIDRLFDELEVKSKQHAELAQGFTAELAALDSQDK